MKKPAFHRFSFYLTIDIKGLRRFGEMLFQQLRYFFNQY